ncbi:hypothetical protein [Pseudoxanthomonas sp. Root630]|uniref:hypothetical protein n=1 Tax=Pseudoxanthomonas sp. Root630 TaxID=1736574 RepID=UPI000703A91A|nr:hypothetical protein [Pseudoxanthomonas sp. Root630]KRA44537.1 hypothetical protein ASD72_11140 [Pseudoxanthomonas sp. Root630]
MARALFAIALLCTPLLVQAQALSGIRVLPSVDRDYPFPGWKHEGPVPASLTVPLELGDEVYGATLQLQPAHAGGKYRVRMQFETSLALGAEGPHLDLIDWKHCVSDWEPADAVDAVTFVLPKPTPEQQSCFPTYTRAELDAAVRAHAAAQGDPTIADGWIPNIDKGDAPGAASPYVAISTVRVRVEVLRKGKWVEVTTLAFQPLMGC